MHRVDGDVPAACTLLIVGAGGYGLAMAAMARHLGLAEVVAGKPGEFWQRHTLPSMPLRSGLAWHVDPFATHTLERYQRERRGEVDSAGALTRATLLRYFDWFAEAKGIAFLRRKVSALRRTGAGFQADLEGGRQIAARWVVAAPGFAPFTHRPSEIVAMLPPGSFTHSGDAFDRRRLTGRSCLIVGGRQSAFEWAAWAAEHGASAIHVAYRHSTPSFAASDWSWVLPHLDRTIADPGWFRDLTAVRQEALRKRFWTEGRLKLEPWLAGRIQRPEVTLHPHTEIVDCRVRGQRLAIGLVPAKAPRRRGKGIRLEVEHVILATGYRMDIDRLDYLAAGQLRQDIATDDGTPRLDAGFQSSVPGLYFAGFPTIQAFGPYFGFLVGAPATAQVIGRGLASLLR